MPIIPIIHSGKKSSSSNVPTPTAEDNGKVLGVANGTYSIMDVPYTTETTTFFSGNATVVELSGK